MGRTGHSLIINAEFPCGDMPSTGLGRGGSSKLELIPPFLDTHYNWPSRLVLLSSWFALPPRSPNVICLPLSVSHPWGPRMSPLPKERSWNSALGQG